MGAKGFCLWRMACLCLLFTGTEAIAQRVPKWLQEAMQPPLKEASEAPAVVLLNEASFDYQSKGRVRETCRFVLRINQTDGRDHARLLIPYLDKVDRVRGAEVWILHPGTKPVRIRKEQIPDRAAYIYRELDSKVRYLHYGASSEVRRGTVFAYEYTVDRRSVFAENRFTLGGELPRQKARLTVMTPKGWEVRAQPSNQRVPFSSAREGDRWMWEATDVPGRKEEAWAMRQSHLHTELRFTVQPESEEARAYPLLSWDNWEGIAAYVGALFAEPITPSPAVEAQSRQLIAGAATPEAQIQAIARFVQEVTYVTIQTDLATGGGYTPRNADQTLSTYYGDCKDKSALLCALLAAVDIPAYPVICRTGDREAIDPEWPSPHQFDHCIVAIEVPDATQWDAVAQHPQLGSLLIFDPTNTSVALGELGHHLQGAFGVICKATSPALLKLPVGDPQRSRTSEIIRATLKANGELQGSMELFHAGLAAQNWRAWKRNHPASQLPQHLIEILAEHLGSVQVEDAQMVAIDGNPLAVSFSFQTRAYGRAMRDRLLVFQPVIFRDRWTPPADENRESPIHFASDSHEQTAEISLPDGFSVEELPNDVVLERAYASYRRQVRAEGGRIAVTRELVWHPDIVTPASEYEAVREFFRAVVEADGAPVVLVKD